MNSLLEGLNGSQRQAVEHTDGPVLVIAGAGSGKTRVLTYRIAHLLEQGVPSYKILALTFTNKAANEMKERIAAIVGPDKAKDLWMGTFHSVFSKILRIESEHLGFNTNFTIYDSQDSKSLISKIISDMNLDKDSYKPGVLASIISKSKNNLITPEAYLQNNDFYKSDSFQKIPMMGEVYKSYVERCRRADAMDFDDLLLYTNVLFRDFPQVLAKYQQRFAYILVDEYQDTNYSQYIIVKKLSLPEKNICVVGDDAQSIYSFRGAKIENILNFSRDYPEYQQFKLEQNYRSTQNIVNAANSLIKKNSKQIPKNVFSEQLPGERIALISTATDVEEGFSVSKKISRMLDSGMQYKDFAILYRTNAQSRIFEEALNKLHIPCRIYGGLSFFQRKEIKDVLAYIRVCINPKDEEALTRIINYPVRGIGNTTIEKMNILSQRNSISLWDVLCHIELAHDILPKATISKLQAFRAMIQGFMADVQQADAYALTFRILEQSGLMRELKADSSLEGKNRYDNVEELLNGIKEFSEQESEERFLPNYLEKIALITDIHDDDADKTNKVTLMTIHSAKGLEFNHCFIVGLEEGLFPSTMNNSMSQHEIEEERRLFYVALTRARQTATLSYSTSRRKWGNLTTSSPSRFISEIDAEYIDQPTALFTSQSRSMFSEEQATPIKKGMFVNFKNNSPSVKKEKIEDFVADNSATITQGQQILHASFGRGMVLSVIGVYPDSVAHIQFDRAGEKKLLLKFAKLKVLS